MPRKLTKEQRKDLKLQKLKAEYSQKLLEYSKAKVQLEYAKQVSAALHEQKHILERLSALEEQQLTDTEEYRQLIDRCNFLDDFISDHENIPVFR